MAQPPPFACGRGLTEQYQAHGGARACAAFHHVDFCFYWEPTSSRPQFCSICGATGSSCRVQRGACVCMFSWPFCTGFLKFCAAVMSKEMFSLSPPHASYNPPSPTSALTFPSQLLLYTGTWRCFAFLFEQCCLMVSQGLWTFLLPKSFIHFQPFVYSACDCILSAVCDFDKAKLSADE